MSTFQSRRSYRTAYRNAGHLIFERLEGRCLLSATPSVAAAPVDAEVFGNEPFSYVDVDNNGFYDATVGDVKLDAEVADGKFDTRKAEGDYTKVVSGAGLVIGGDPITANSISFTADGQLRERADLTAKDDVCLTSRKNSVLMLEGSTDEGPAEPLVTITSTKGTIKIRADLDFKSWGDTFDAAKELDVKAGGQIRVVNSVIDAGSRVELKADDVISFIGDGERIGPSTALTAKDVTFKAGSDIVIRDSDYEGPTITTKGKFTLDAGGNIEIAGSSADFVNQNTVIDVGTHMDVRAKGDVSITGFSNGGTETPVDITTGGNFKVRAGGTIDIGPSLGDDGSQTPVSILATGYIEIKAPETVTATFAGQATQIKITSKDGDVDMTDAVFRASRLIDIDADLLADMTRAKLGILAGNSNGQIEASAKTIDLTDAELVAPNKFRLRGTLTGTPAVFDENGTV